MLQKLNNFLHSSGLIGTYELMIKIESNEKWLLFDFLRIRRQYKDSSNTSHTAQSKNKNSTPYNNLDAYVVNYLLTAKDMRKTFVTVFVFLSAVAIVIKVMAFPIPPTVMHNAYINNIQRKAGTWWNNN